ncbi:hypothetical protein SSP35_35_00240 [Streptomyces sp. NBRC 110611]|nr:hypothetical protein SSP35_35_00240 [Streptomyces sp. NBRC 110611]
MDALIVVHRHTVQNDIIAITKPAERVAEVMCCAAPCSGERTEAWRERASSIGAEVPSSAAWVRAQCLVSAEAVCGRSRVVIEQVRRSEEFCDAESGMCCIPASLL